MGHGYRLQADVENSLSREFTLIKAGIRQGQNSVFALHLLQVFELSAFVSLQRSADPIRWIMLFLRTI